MTTTTPEKTRRTPRFKRAPGNNITINARDIEILKQVHRHRFISSEHITALIEGSQQSIVRRLGLLYHAGYLDRPKEQLGHWIYSKRIIYGLGNKGADILAGVLDLPRSKIDWTTKNREAGTVFLNHTLMIANFMVCLELACRTSDITIIWPDDILDEMPARDIKSGSPFGWNVTIQRPVKSKTRDIKIGIVPDAVFGLEFEQGDVAYYFLEADCSTMPIIRSSFDKSSYLKKLLAYWSAKETGQIEAIFGFKAPRVLTLAISRDRIKSMIEANKGIDPRKAGFRMFYFARAADFSIKDPTGIFAKQWVNGREELCSMLD
ncbi:MAG TPA: replication-relaxation family protein [Desulfatiglandales bacterium]|nr:replication-relaxation family protein [Desulfatiglandales bacterium]